MATATTSIASEVKLNSSIGNLIGMTRSSSFKIIDADTYRSLN